MSIDIAKLRAAVDNHGVVARLTVAAVAGSTPREVGASMLVWPGGQSGTIGGGTLEYDAARLARAKLKNLNATDGLIKIPLGPSLGQCCGGTVTLLSEMVTADVCAEIQQQLDKYNVYARPVAQDARPQPLHIKRVLAGARAGNPPATSTLSEGWFAEPADPSHTPLWIFGAGHVGRALVQVFDPLPFDITWLDTHTSRFPRDIPATVTQLTAENPAAMVGYAPNDAHHLVLTYSHALDLEICHRLLNHNFQFAGLIGSKTKWARFRKRLAQLGHPEQAIVRIACPIGLPELGKTPQAIAVGVAAKLLLIANNQESLPQTEKDVAHDHTS